MSYICPSCGFPGLHEPPRSATGGASYDICPSCGFQFGVSDDDQGYTYATWRALWKKQGCPWSSKGIASPRGWNAAAQLATLKNKATRKAPARKAKSGLKAPRKK